MDPPTRRPAAFLAPGPSKSDQHAAPIDRDNMQSLESAQAFVAPARSPRTTISAEPAGQLTFDFGRSFPVPAQKAKHSAPALSAKADLLVFPLARRRALIVKLAYAVQTASTPEMGENLLRGALTRLCRSLRRRPIPEKIIAAQLCALEGEVRGELWRISMGSRFNG
jgi:hypothetical protein